ncbi:homoserine kinase [Saxibacter everestensis]|uniref:Homoserine kinase n=1 Tax=Saxibacter everestensis TaxID=2909229 RepID=A0ABY8QQG5_9MICO|nr:homoserine kinase [Brevibacteriaceae bacterium ZFBP1038]
MNAVFTPGTRISVSVPATSANLGPGYDSLGIALDLRDELHVEVLEPGSTSLIVVSGEGAGTLPDDETHLVLKTLRIALSRAGVEGGGDIALKLRCSNLIPHSRGLGSSAAAVVSGIAAASALLESAGEAGLDADAQLALATELEGHPDNAAPALRGGATVSWLDDDGAAHAAPLTVSPDIGFVVVIPAMRLSTEAARGLIPETVSHRVAASNSARTALLVHALASDPRLLLAGTEDFLHQEFRRPAMRYSLELVDALRAENLAAVVSGAGPTVLVMSAEPELADRVQRVLGLLDERWSATGGEPSVPRTTVRSLRLADAGARCLAG